MAQGIGWPALVLTAGLGTRFRPLSAVRAKPAAPVAGLPLVRRILGWLATAGVRDVVLNLHHKPDTIIAAVGDGGALGLRVRYSWERDEALGSAGGPRQALPLLGAPRFLLVNGDTLCPIDLAAMVRQHVARGALVTMALVPNPDPARYGGVVVDERRFVRGFSRRGRGEPGEGLFVGVQVVEAQVFAGLRAGRPAETVRELYPALIERDRSSVQAYFGDAPFHDVGTPGDYLETCLAFARSEGLTALPHGAGTVVAPTARVVRSALWDDVVVGDRCEVVECVLADGVSLEPGTRLCRSVVVPADGLTPAAGEVVKDGLLIAGMPR